MFQPHPTKQQISKAPKLEDMIDKTSHLYRCKIEKHADGCRKKYKINKAPNGMGYLQVYHKIINGEEKIVEGTTDEAQPNEVQQGEVHVIEELEGEGQRKVGEREEQMGRRRKKKTRKRAQDRVE
ncbi:hypothetical protein HDV00_008119 [Rhizophlyctis rosea]|nr:hypothetical protein HDV00_008119 [Rhizophlyctis rosea]